MTIEQALRKAFQLGQDYWRQADSESYRQNALSCETKAKFDSLLEEMTGAESDWLSALDDQPKP